MFNHVAYLPFHRDEKQNYKVKQKNRPKHRDIKDFKEGHEKGRDSTTNASIPKFELRYTSGKRSVEGHKKFQKLIQIFKKIKI